MRRVLYVYVCLVCRLDLGDSFVVLFLLWGPRGCDVSCGIGLSGNIFERVGSLAMTVFFLWRM